MRHGLADERDARVHQKVVAPFVKGKYLRDVTGRVRVGCCCPGPELGQAGLERIQLKCDELVGHR